MTTLTDIIDYVSSGTKPFREWEKGVANRMTPQGFGEAVLDQMPSQENPMGAFGMGAISKVGKFPLANRMSTDEYDSLGNYLSTINDNVVKGTHLIRGRTGYLGGPDYYGPNKSEVSDLFSDYEKSLISTDKKFIDEFEDELLDTNMGANSIVDKLKGSETVLDKPLYMTREEGLYHKMDPEFKGDVTVSARTVDPSIPKQYEESNFGDYSIGGVKPEMDAKMYRLDPGQSFFHPMGLADEGEAVVMRSTLDKAKSMDMSEYAELVRRGLAPFSIASLGLLGLRDDEL